MTCKGNCNQGRAPCDCSECRLRPARGIINELILSALMWIVIIGGVLLLGMLGGCSAIGHKPPPSDWPQLNIVKHEAGFFEIQSYCGGNLLVQNAACANINFDTMTCTVYISNGGDEYAVLALEHEMDHCSGKDHIGTSQLADYWEAWKKQNRGGGK